MIGSEESAEPEIVHKEKREGVAEDLEGGGPVEFLAKEDPNLLPSHSSKQGKPRSIPIT